MPHLLRTQVIFYSLNIILIIDGAHRIVEAFEIFALQILDWLSHSPTDIEGYIRPGCIVLTIYLRLNNALWEEVLLLVIE